VVVYGKVEVTEAMGDDNGDDVFLSTSTDVLFLVMCEVD
jgi:hypothetical protein